MLGWRFHRRRHIPRRGVPMLARWPQCPDLDRSDQASTSSVRFFRSTSKSAKNASTLSLLSRRVPSRVIETSSGVGSLEILPASATHSSNERAGLAGLIRPAYRRERHENPPDTASPASTLSATTARGPYALPASDAPWRRKDAPVQEELSRRARRSATRPHARSSG